MASKAVRLSFIGAAEDVPRRIGAHARTSAGEVALVLRPREQQGALIVVLRDRSAVVWTAKLSRDSPQNPDEETSAERALSVARSFVTDPGQPGPIRLRGQWTGTFSLENDGPRVTLQRRITSYGALLVESHGSKGWRWRFQRAEGWFAKAGTNEGGPTEALSEAIEAGIKGAMGLVKEACSFRDTRRRAAHDATFAERHPIKPPKDGADPTAKVKTPPPRKEKAPKAERPKPAKAEKPPKAEKPTSPPKAPRTPKTEKPMPADRASTATSKPAKASARPAQPAATQQPINPEWERQLLGAVGSALDEALSRLDEKE